MTFSFVLGSLIGCITQSLVGSLPGANQAICPSFSLPLGCEPIISTRLPVPNRSTYWGVSLQALCQITCSFQCPGLPLGCSYQWQGSPGNPMTIRSGQPSPLRSSAQHAKL